MEKYILHLFQEGGCDYTIGCGHAIEEIEVEEEGDLKDKLKELITGWSRDYLDKATIYKVSQKEELNIDELFAEDDAEDMKIKEQEEVDRELRLLKKLRNKYPNA